MTQIRDLLPLEYLNTDSDMQNYINAMLEENGIRGFKRALGNIAMAYGMSVIAEKYGMTKEELYKVYSASDNSYTELVGKTANSMGVSIQGGL